MTSVAELDASLIASATLVIGVVTCLSLLVPERDASRVDAAASLRQAG